MKNKLVKFVLIILLIACFFQEKVYAASLVSNLEFNNFKMDYYKQFSLIPEFHSPLSNNIINPPTSPEIFIIKNGQCVAYKPLNAHVLTGWQNKDGSSYTGSVNFYLHDMDYSVCVYKYNFKDSNFVNESTTITRIYAALSSPTDTIPYSATNKITKDVNDTGINEGYTCFYYDNDGKDLYVQYVTEFPDVTVLDELSATLTFDFTNLTGKMNLSNGFVIDSAGTSSGALANSEQLKYLTYMTSDNSGNIQTPIVFQTDFAEVPIANVNFDSFDRLWCVFNIKSSSPYVCVSENCKYILNGNTYQVPFAVNSDKFLYAYLSEYEVGDSTNIAVDNTYNGFCNAYETDAGLFIQFYINKNDTPPIDPPSPKSPGESSGYQVVNTGVY